MEKIAITRNKLISELTKSPHGKLEEYVPTGRIASLHEPEFLAHLIAWNEKKGQVRDSKVALPVLALGSAEPEFVDNALAHLALLSPRDLLRAVRFAMSLKTKRNAIRRLVTSYLRTREEKWGWWQRAAVQHRGTLKELYALLHIKPSGMADSVLFKGERPAGSIFATIATLKDMEPLAAASAIVEWKIPFLIALGALGEKAKNTDLVLALIERMSPAELVNNTKMLERLGIKTVPALRAAYTQALEKASKDKRASTFKAGVAAEAMEDEGLKVKLQALQEQKIKKDEGIDGDWLVLGDKSGSMHQAIDVSRHVAATLAKMVKGKVHLIFFDTQARYVPCTGKTYEEILAATKHVSAEGGTSLGAGLLGLIERDDHQVDGIAMVTDGEETTPPLFTHVYKSYSELVGKEVPVYMYQTVGGYCNLTASMSHAGYDMQVFDLCGGVDYYSLPNLVKTMRTRRYGLVQEIMDTPLLTLEMVIPKRESVAA